MPSKAAKSFRRPFFCYTKLGKSLRYQLKSLSFQITHVPCHTKPNSLLKAGVWPNFFLLFKQHSFCASSHNITRSIPNTYPLTRTNICKSFSLNKNNFNKWLISTSNRVSCLVIWSFTLFYIISVSVSVLVYS